ncbi:MAG: hypothetical protein RR486_15925 [Clostridium sp.]|uniref:hypothetical protein n=1 Tax=Clostridium sp. TaxID=1506 RepID=UPI0030576C34
MNSRVIVFIVEGFSDKETLNSILSELYEDKKIIFSVVDGDITTRHSTKIDNIRSQIGECINRVIQRDKILKSDIDKVIHLIDTDGAFIKDVNVIYNEMNALEYKEDGIYTSNVDGIKKRNAKKTEIVNLLSTMTAIYKGKNSIPYFMFYMSCNLEHVLHNIQNAKDDEKVNLAEDLEDKYIDEPQKFVKFMSESDFTVQGSYKETWEFIKNGNNSLLRYSNFHLFFY